MFWAEIRKIKFYNINGSKIYGHVSVISRCLFQEHDLNLTGSMAAKLTIIFSIISSICLSGLQND